jgi:hypothetical protein
MCKSKALKSAGGIQFYTVTQEESREDGKTHVHIYVEFRRAIDAPSTIFKYKDINPNVRACYLGSALGNKMGRGRSGGRLYYDRGHFYVWADKIGTLRNADGSPRVFSNIAAAWCRNPKSREHATFKGAHHFYRVEPRWIDDLWSEDKLDDAVCKYYRMRAKKGLAAFSRNFELQQEMEQQEFEAAYMKGPTERVHKRRRKFLKIPPVEQWLRFFDEEEDRYPMLILYGESFSGKSIFASELGKNVLEVPIGVNVESVGPAMREFRLGFHDLLLFDDVRDIYWIVKNQEKLQAHIDKRVSFCETKANQLAYMRRLWKTPHVITINDTTENLEMLVTNGFVKRPTNCIFVRIHQEPTEGAKGKVWSQEYPECVFEATGQRVAPPPPKRLRRSPPPARRSPSPEMEEAPAEA